MLAAYLRRAWTLPPHIVAGRAARLLRVHAQQRLARARDLQRSTYAPDAGQRLAPLLRLDASAIPADLVAALPELCDAYRAHRFDLLGSGPLEVRHDFEADADGAWLAGRVSEANLGESRRIWRLIEGPYRPIDWHRDFKSGEGWPAHAHIRDLSFADRPGVDVKVPWELSRLQHLPQLATAHLAAAAERPGFAEPASYAREAQNQMLDFLAANPPRFGICWLGTMDVAIRAANLVLTHAILEAGGWRPPAEVSAVLARAIIEHARHVMAHLEWSPEARGNHYICDIVGVLFCAAALPGCRESDDWLAFAADQIEAELAFQFLDDGASFEGSTNYHRLSTEALLFAAVLLLGRSEARADAFKVALAERRTPHLKVRPPLSRTPPAGSMARDGRAIALSAPTVARLARALSAANAWLKPDGRAPQVGDTDSGRLFRLHPAHPLDHREMAAIGAAVFAGRDNGAWFGAAIARALASGRALPATEPETAGGSAVEPLADIEARIASLPAERQRTWTFVLDGLRPDRLRCLALPDFGLYVLKDSRSYVALRCVTHPPGLDHGHTHDDNLALELHHDGEDLIADPGSLLYTPAPEVRERYRAATAHFAPRPAAGPAAARPLAPFALRHVAGGTCLHVSQAGLAGRLDGPGWTVLRAVRLEPGRIIVRDGCLDGPLAADRSDSVTISEGYGVLGTRPVRNV